ncbi:MAG: AAA family ATPase [Chlamydiales bacterium]|nr:AAA family ATPase [Chlamydiales bacterium]
MNPFFGRQKELEQLNRLLKKSTASLAVIKGRRRVGKSRLAEEFGKSHKTFTFIGLAPEAKVTAKMQRKNFTSQMQHYFKIPGLQDLSDWSDILWHLAEETKKGQIVIILDEINWIGSKDPTFLGKLKTSWDQYFKRNPKLVMILSGSMSAWIEKNILSSTAFVGRISLDLTLQELPLNQCSHFWRKQESRVSSYEKFKLLSVTGGIPRYLEEIDPTVSSDENIQRLCFEKEGMLFSEFEKIFNDLFAKKGEVYRKILERLAAGKANMEDICEAIQMKKGGTVSKYLHTLKITGFIAQDSTWNLKDGTVSKLSYYRLRDNYTRFYLKYVKPNKEKIEQGVITKPPAWDTIMGLQFENLVVNNCKILWQKLNIKPDDIVFANPFFQKSTETQEGCQIDYLIQTKYNVLYLFEIKFSRDSIKSSITDEVKEKIKRLKTPKHFSIMPVLIHVGDVSDQVTEAEFFSHIIDFADFLSDSQ